MVNLKHMLEREKFFVLGKPIDLGNRHDNTAMAVAAYSSRFKDHERVDTMFFEGTDTHYGLTLPEGNYDFLLYADIDNNGVFDNSEIVTQESIVINKETFPTKIVKNFNLEINQLSTVSWAKSFPTQSTAKTKISLFYPQGTIRTLSDAVFDANISTMGMYDPASFLQHAPTMFYALDEDQVHKIPIVFVHGINGSARNFQKIIDRLDRDRYRPWFFHYPSGGDLDQLASLFYNLFLSGDVIPLNGTPLIVVAHSMGGLVVRESFNHYRGVKNENKVDTFISIATPFNGHPSAESGENNGLIVLPAWRDLNPNNAFIKKLYRKPLPEFINHQLYYTFKNDKTLKLSENSDGVVPLSSQLRTQAQRQSQNQFGFNYGHVEILESREMIDTLLDKFSNVEGMFPEHHMKILENGGFDLQLSRNYSPQTQHLIAYAGRYLLLMIGGAIKPFHEDQEKFIRAVNGLSPATSDIEKEFILFVKEYPHLLEASLREYPDQDPASNHQTES